MLKFIPKTEYFKPALVLLLFLFSIQGNVCAQAPDILYYKFDGIGSNVPNEATSPPLGTNTATIIGSLTQGPGGQCHGGLIGAALPSDTNYLNTNWAPNLGNNSWSISFWINNDASAGSSPLYYVFGDLNSSRFRCFTNGVAGLNNYILRGDGMTDVYVNGGAAPGLQYIVFVYDALANNLRAYLNGTLVNTVPQGTLNLSGSGPLKVGGYSSNVGLAAGTILDEFAIYGRPLDIDEIEDLFQAGCTNCYTDADGDGYGDPSSEPVAPVENTCPFGYADNSTDCDDNNPSIYPGAPINLCNGLDNDCNGIVDSEPAEQIPCTRFIGFSPFQDSLWVIDTVNGFEIIIRASPDIPGFTITGINGAAMNPVNDSIYVICKVNGVSGRVLGTIDVETFEVTVKGNLGDNFSSITFGPDGTMYGVTGDGASVPETLYEIDPSNASKTLLTTLGNGADGEVICFNPDDNHIYHWSGNSTVVFEKILAETPYTVTSLNGSAGGGEVFGAAYVGNGLFLTSNIGSSFSYFDVSGTRSASFGSMPDDLRGLPFMNCSVVSCYLDADGDGYGDPSQTGTFAGVCPEGYVTNNYDCNDDPLQGGASVYPCAIEICDGLDNDCNGLTDDEVESFSAWTQTAIGQSTGDSEYPVCSSEEGDSVSISANGYSSLTVDGMQLVHQEICHDASITARISNISGLGWAGITIRETAAPGSKKVVLKMQMNGNFRREIRSTTNGNTHFLTLSRPGHTWLRIVRQGNTFIGYTSINGTNWIFAFTAHVLMNSCVLVGLQVESLNQSETTSASFSNVIITGIKPADIPRTVVENRISSQSFEIYPNPARGDLYFNNSKIQPGIVNFNLYDIHGRVVFTQTFEGLDAGNHTLTLPDLTDGIYLMQIHDSYELIQTNKIVILKTGQ